MKYGTVFLLAFLLLFPSVSRAVETPLGDFPEWGESADYHEASYYQARQGGKPEPPFQCSRSNYACP